MQIDWVVFITAITNNTLFVAIIAALIATLAVPWQFLRQKTYNDIDETFIKNGVLEFRNFLHSQRSIVDHNYATAINIFRNIRDLDYNSFVGQFESLKNEFNQSQVTAALPASSYGVNELLGNNPNFIKLMADVVIGMYHYNGFLKYELFIDFDKILINEQNFNSFKTRADETVKEIKDKFNKPNILLHGSLVLFLERIEIYFRERRISNYSQVYNFYNLKKVKEYMTTLLSKPRN